MLGEPVVLHALFRIGEEEAHNTQMTVAVCICNLSANPALRDVLLDKHVVKALTTLSAAGGESVQQLCAIAFCNLTCEVRLDHLRTMAAFCRRTLYGGLTIVI